MPMKNYNPNYLILVNKKHPLSPEFAGTVELVDAPNTRGRNLKAEKTAYEAYCALRDWLRTEKNIIIGLDSAYRSIEKQQQIIDRFTEKFGAEYAYTYAAAPGTSEHHTGLALDIVPFLNGRFLLENDDMFAHPELWPEIHKALPDFGFILRYPQNGYAAYEPWHIRYVGKEAAKEITEGGWLFEDYIASKAK